MSEGIFKGMLLRESKRMERSDRSFALLLVSLDAVVGEDPLVIWGSVVEALNAAKRDTDVLGWFQRGVVLGVVLTEIESRDAALVCGIEMPGFAMSSPCGSTRRRRSSVSIRLHAHPDLKRKCDAVRRAPPIRCFGRSARGIAEEKPMARSSAALDILGAVRASRPAFAGVCADRGASQVDLEGSGVFQADARRRSREAVQDAEVPDDVRVNADPAIHQEFVTRFITPSEATADEPGKDAPFKIVARPAGHADRTLPPQDQPRRAAAVLERRPGRDVARRPASAASLRGRAV